jgi:hypothetical protein
LVGAVVALLAPLAAAAGPEVETRDFNVFVDGKPAGEVHMTMKKQEDGAVLMNCDTDIKISVFLKQYVYSYRGSELWKNGRLQRFDSVCDDDGRRHVISAVIDGDRLSVRVNNSDKKMRGDIWLTSYWAMPDNARINKVVPIMDADTGADLEAKVTFVGVEQRNVAGQAQKVNHFRLTGKAQAELWYDVSGRLVSEEFVEEGHRTQIELVRLRR